MNISPLLPAEMVTPAETTRVSRRCGFAIGFHSARSTVSETVFTNLRRNQCRFPRDVTPGSNNQTTKTKYVPCF